MSSSPSQSERSKVGMLVPPPVLLLGLAVVGVVAHLAWFGHFVSSVFGAVAGAVVIVGSLALLRWSALTFKRSGTPVRPTSPAVAVVRHGPYRFSRNPMYVAMVGLLSGFGLVSGSWFFAAAALVFAVVVHFGVVLPEERYMESLHGEAFLEFKSQVRRWL